MNEKQETLETNMKGKRRNSEFNRLDHVKEGEKMKKELGMIEKDSGNDQVIINNCYVRSGPI